ncbi:MAG TPA: CYTH domain-containing protein [Candidatus Paceibacterota bacterium]
MIEIEKNFDLKLGDKERIIKNAKFIKRREFTDVYYDTSDYKLTTNDFWLRQRDDKWELKVPIKNIAIQDGAIDRYHELEKEKDIAKKLKNYFDISFDKGLREKILTPFATIVTKRETYQKNEFHLDFDEMDFGFLTFEAELMISDEREINDAERKIKEFAENYDIDPTKGRGKVIEYLFRKNPNHYQSLVNAGVIRN